MLRRTQALHHAMAGPSTLTSKGKRKGDLQSSQRKILQRTYRYDLSILAYCRTNTVANKHNMQNDIIIPHISMMLMCFPIAGPNMKFNIAYIFPWRTQLQFSVGHRVEERWKAQYGIMHIWSHRPTRISRNDYSNQSPATKWQHATAHH